MGQAVTSRLLSSDLLDFFVMLHTTPTLQKALAPTLGCSDTARRDMQFISRDLGSSIDIDKLSEVSRNSNSAFDFGVEEAGKAFDANGDQR